MSCLPNLGSAHESKTWLKFLFDVISKFLFNIILFRLLEIWALESGIIALFFGLTKKNLLRFCC